MIRYAKIKDTMRHDLVSKELTWVTVQSPEAEELAEFIRDCDLLPRDAEFVAHENHQPSVTMRDGYVLVLVQVPVFDRKLRLTLGVPLFLVIKEGFLYTLHYEPIIAMDKARRDLEQSVEWREELFGEGAAALAVELLSILNEGSLRKLGRLAKHIDIAEDAVFQGNERKMVEEVSLLTRDVMDFRKVVRPQRDLFLVAPVHPLVPDEVATLWRRINGQYMRMWDVLESMMESVRELSSTNFTLLQHKENELLRLLTIYSIVVIPMLILTDPFFSPRAADASVIDDIVFWATLGVLVVVLGAIFVHVRRKRLW